MFGDDEGVRFGQIEHLTGVMTDARFRLEARAAHRAGHRVMVDDVIGICDLPQGLAFVTLLPARFPVGPFAQVLHPRRLLQAITRWRLAAVRTVQSQPALEFGELRFQGRNFRPQRSDQFVLGRFVWRLRKHPILESETASIVQEILQPIRTAVARRYRLLRRWLAATRTGQSQPAPEFDEPRRRLQACNFSLLRLGNLASNYIFDYADKFATWQLCGWTRIHRTKCIRRKNQRHSYQ